MCGNTLVLHSNVREQDGSTLCEGTGWFYTSCERTGWLYFVSEEQDGNTL